MNEKMLGKKKSMETELTSLISKPQSSTFRNPALSTIQHSPQSSTFRNPALSAIQHFPYYTS